MEPRPEQSTIADRACLASQAQKGRLERVLGILVVTGSLPADAHDHRPVPRHEHLERILGLAGLTSQEFLDEFLIGFN